MENRETRNTRRSGQAGITLIEMLVVVTIIALFAALVLPKMMHQADRARITAAHAQINAYLTALGSYKLDTGVFPTTDQGLQALRQRPEAVENWQGPYLQKEIENDPWQHPYVYRFPGEHGDEPDIVSYGADGQPGGDGINADIVSWKN
jgi:general secretion pathway protein G